MSPAATTLPFSMMAKRRPARRANSTFCSTRITVRCFDTIEAQYNLLDFFDDGGLNPLGRFIEQQYLRLRGERARNGELLLLSARQHAATAIQVLDEIRKQLGHQARDRAASVGSSESAKQNVFANGEIGDDLAALRHIGKAGARAPEGRLGGYVVVAEPDLAGRPIGQTHDGLEQRSFAGAVAAKDGGDLARLHFEIHAVQHMTAAVIAVDLDELKHQLIALEPR